MAAFDSTISLMHRRGFVYQSSEIYGGLQASYDYAHYGVLLKTNIKNAWLKAMRTHREIVLQDAAILMHPGVWEASGHVERFSDPLVQCVGTCKKRWRADHLESEVCPECGGDLSEPIDFNLMFSTQLGPNPDSSSKVWLRPETAQAMFVNFLPTIDTQRRTVPFGIAQIGKSFRNEITARQFLFRTREFEQAELEYFVHPDDSMDAYAQWREERMNWWYSLGLEQSRLRLRDHETDELSHYSSATADVEYRFDDMGWSEVEGVAHRGDFDLKAHAAATGSRVRVQDARGHYTPHVIEPAMGVDRAFLAVVEDAYDVEDVESGADGVTRQRTVLRLKPSLAPVTAAVMPIVKRGEVAELADTLEASLRPYFSTEFDAVGNIGKAYRRQDEIGTPWCIAVDHQSIDDGQVTIRDRDSMEQIRIPIDGVRRWIDDQLAED